MECRMPAWRWFEPTTTSATRWTARAHLKPSLRWVDLSQTAMMKWFRLNENFKFDTSDSKNSRQAENDSLVTDVCLISVLPKSLPPYIVLDVQPGGYRWTVERWGRGESVGEEVPVRGGQQRPGSRLQLRQQQKGERSWMWWLCKTFPGICFLAEGLMRRMIKDWCWS